MLSCQHSKNVIDGKKRIILAPSQEQRSGFETVTFAEGETYGVDILVTTGEDGKVGFIIHKGDPVSLFLLGTDRGISHHDLPTGV